MASDILHWLMDQPFYQKANLPDQKSMISWLKSRPKNIQEAVQERPPWNFYRIGDSGSAYGKLHSYYEDPDGSVKVHINLFKNTAFPRQVFDVSLDDLVEVVEN